MTGHIRRRGDASWELKFDIDPDPATGKRRSRYHSFKGTKREAQIELAKLVAANAKGEYVDPTRLTVGAFLDRWDRDYASVNVTPKTLERYRQLVRLQIKPTLGAAKLQKLKAVNLTELYSRLLRGDGCRRYAPRTVGHVHRLLHQALHMAVTWTLIPSNPADAVSAPRVDQEEIVILTEDQVARLIRRVTGSTLRPIVILMLTSGVRRGEALALRWSDVDLDAGKIKIERSLEQTKAGLRFKAPKTKHGRRTMSIPPATVRELRAHLVRQSKLRLQIGIGKSPNDSLVFQRFDGETRKPHWLTQKFGLVVEGLKFEGITLHCLRHTHVSHLIAEGMDILSISRRIGHGSAKITLDVYGHLFRSTDDRAAQIMERAFAGFGTE